jgi:ribosomal protein S27AE
MAIVRITSYTKRPDLAKRTVRYIVHRRDRDEKRITRDLFGQDGKTEKPEVYRAIDRAPRGTRFYRFVISPAPKREDTRRDLNLRELTENTMLVLQEKFAKQGLQFFAAAHNDHTDKRHVHLLVMMRGWIGKEDLKALRETATAEAAAQRKELDRGQARVQAQQRQAVRTPTSQQTALGRDDGPIRPARTRQTCPSCGPGVPMERHGRYYECPSCGLSAVRSSGPSGRHLETVQERSLELSLEEGGTP